MIDHNSLQQASDQYWLDCQNTCLVAPPEFYQKQEQFLKEDIFNKIKIDSALDIGCGDGRFTKIICENANFVKAFDISKLQVQKAKTKLKKYNVEITQESIFEFDFTKSYDLISCQGVTMYVIDHNMFLKIVSSLIQSCKTGGYILTKDTLSTTKEQLINRLNESEGIFKKHVAMYRNIDDYKNIFLSNHCSLIDSKEIYRDNSREIVSRIFLFKLES